MSSHKRLHNLKTRIHQLSTDPSADLNNITPEEIQCLMYELQCHQIELEMQNDELIKAQLQLTALNNRLNLIYHQVPVAILTLDNKGFIKAANLNSAIMLRTEVNKLINTPFARFIVREDLYPFIRGYNDYFSNPANKSLRLKLESENTGIFPVLIKGIADDGSDIDTGAVDIEKRSLIIVITDISSVELKPQP